MITANDNISQADADWSHIELSAGTVTDAYIDGAEGRRALPAEIGQLRFFIDAIDVRGGRLGLDIAEDYEAAIRLAELARVDLQIDFPVRDNVVGTH